MRIPVVISRVSSLAAFLFLSLAICAHAQTVTNLANFFKANGWYPEAQLVQGRNGNLYGTTALGGQYNDGTVFTITPEGRLNTLHSFTYDEGYEPTALVLDKYGNFFGITSGGGPGGGGTVFKITPSGNYSIVYAFHGDDGASPNSLVLGPDGDFYGTFLYPQSSYFFRISPAGRYSPLPCAVAGAYSLSLGPDGYFYGTTLDGGSEYGSIFQLRPNGLCKTLHVFDGTDGSAPGYLTLNSNGNFYGSTEAGGTGIERVGTFFQISPSGEFNVLFSYPGTTQPLSRALALGSDGNLYGTNLWGGLYGGGVVYQTTIAGSFNILVSFGAEVYYTLPAMIQHSNGIFYGVSAEGGNQGNGNVFSFDNSLSPFLGFVIGFGHPGNNTQFLGQGFTGTTAVSFNGTPASNFKIISDTYMTAVVPEGATTGLVTVTTPSGPLISKLNFVVE
jgi:uncharacterized repeat protein (TIGR03803 family)